MAMPSCKRALLGVIVLFLVQEAVGLHLRWVDDETWYLIPARTLLTEGRVRVPVFNDASREFFPLPPLLSVLEAISWRIHDLTIVQARLLTVGFGVGTILATFGLARRLFGERVAVAAALLCALENMIFLAGRTVRPEILVAFFTVTALCLLLKAVQDATRWPLVLAGFSVGAGMSAHPNGAAASLCGVALLWFFEGPAFIRHYRIYAFALCCVLAFLPLVVFFVVNDAPHNFEGFRSLTNAHDSRGATLLQRLANSAATEFTVRYALFSTFPYRLHLALLSLAAVVVSLARRNRSTRFIASCILIHLLFFVFVKANTSPRYMTLVMPFVSIIWGEWLVALWTIPDWSGAFGRWVSGTHRARALAAVLFAFVGVSQIVGNAAYVWKFRDARTDDVCQQINSLIPPRSTIYGAMAFWIGLKDHTYVPYMRMPWAQAVNEFRPNIVILDDSVMVKGTYPGEWDQLRTELHDYVDAHGTLLGGVSNEFYGDLKIYSVTHP